VFETVEDDEVAGAVVLKARIVSKYGGSDIDKTLLHR
jgi:hypothetical protein